MTILGIDCCKLQGRFDWGRERLVGNTRFAYVKCTQGNEVGRDSMFSEYCTSANNVGIPVGAYHFAYPLESSAAHPGRDPKSQAAAFFNATRDVELQLPPAIDLEWPSPDDFARWNCTGESIAAWGLSMAEEVYRLFNRLPIIYTYPYFWKEVLKADPFVVSQYSSYPLWLSDYDKNHEFPVLEPFGAPIIVQRSGGGYILSNGARCDRNEFMGSEVDFSVFTGAAVMPPPAA